MAHDEGSFKKLLTSLSVEPHTRGKQFERIARWWLVNTPINPFAEHTIEDVWLWEEWPDRPGPDTGIDIVARLSDGTLCAVQAKCVDESADIPKSQLDSFISAASTHVFKHRLLIATTDGLSANARRMLQEQRVIRVMRTELEDSLAVWPQSIEELNTPITQPKWEPRPHQQEAIDNVVTGLEEHDRGQLIMACGTGKTLTALWITEQLNPHTTLVLVPSLSLLSQTLSEWARHTNTTWSYICVCSDDTVNKHNDEPISTVDDFPFEVTTDPNRIAAFLASSGRKVIFSTYQSSAQVATALRATPTAIDFAICDEAHRLTGKTNADYATILDNSKIPASKRLFMTATPRTYTAAIKKKAEERGVEVTSMDDESTYGPVLHKLSFGEAIERELLSDYRVVIVGVTDHQVQELIDRRELVSINGQIETDARTLAAHIGLAKATKDYELARVISFHSRINTAAKFSKDHAAIIEWLPDTHRPNGTIWSETISGAMNTGHRRRILNQLREDKPHRHALLTNARCLTEGIDVPSLDGVAFIDPKSSQGDIIQAVGRAIRKSSSKTTGTIVLPVLIDTKMLSNQEIEKSAFKTIWVILSALKSHDERLCRSLDFLSFELGKTGQVGNLPEMALFDLPLEIGDVLPSLSQQLSLTTIEYTGDNWNFWLGLLADYVDQHGSAHVNQTVIWRGHGLGHWVNKQRTSFRRGLLSIEQVEILESLPFWTWDPVGDRRATLFRLLKQFAEREGHSRVPAQHVEETLGLGEWVTSIRKKFRDGRLGERDRRALESIVGWSWDPTENDWQIRFLQLKNYLDANEGKYPANPRGADGAGLGKWIVRQRQRYAKGWCREEQIELLESLPGWLWDPWIDVWEQHFRVLENYVDREGHARPPANYEESGLRIGNWVSRQRQRFKENRIPTDQIRRLEQLVGWSWDPLSDNWMLYFQRCATLETTNPMIQRGSIASDLLKWMKDQRERYAQGLLSKERIQLLEGLQDWYWQPRDQTWDAVFAAFAEWAKGHNANRVPQDVQFAGANGRSWTENQRTRFRNGKLSPRQIEKLESVPGWSWSRYSTRWDQRFEQLRQAIEEERRDYGDLDASLKEWIRTQHRRRRTGTIPAHHISLLEALPEWNWRDTPTAQTPPAGH